MLCVPGYVVSAHHQGEGAWAFFWSSIGANGPNLIRNRPGSDKLLVPKMAREIREIVEVIPVIPVILGYHVLGTKPRSPGPTGTEKMSEASLMFIDSNCIPALSCVCVVHRKMYAQWEPCTRKSHEPAMMVTART